ncbi:hypothetical protein ACTJK5_09495 [Agrobacterium sp. 22094]|uniref:hypothetical protein n=1 Tax=Agrobacterium sp. 22094 TaxID=3453872 RepID=UPI003F84D232
MTPALLADAIYTSSQTPDTVANRAETMCSEMESVIMVEVGCAVSNAFENPFPYDVRRFG